MLAFMAGAAMISCEENLDLAPEDTLSPGIYFSNASQLELWTNQYYSQMSSADDCAQQCAEDNIDADLSELLMGQRTAASENGWTWTMLRKINYYLQNSGNCEDINARTQYDGVSYFMRAYFYFNKVRRYGDVPWYNQVLNSDDDELLIKPRDSRTLVMDSIMVDMDRAIAMLPTKKDQVHVTKWTALALKSRIALYEGTWRKYRGIDGSDKFLQLAVEAAEEFIDNSGYKLYNTGSEPYRTLFNSIDCVSDEVILTRKYSNTANVMHSIPFNIINNRQGLTKRFVNHYLMADGSYFSGQDGWQTLNYVKETQNRDPRMAQTILCPGYIQTGAKVVSVNDMASCTGYRPIKFVGNSAYDGASKAFSDFPLFRAAEVYLNFAEAKAELGSLKQSDLDKSVNLIRKRAGMPDLLLDYANAHIDPLMMEYYPNVTKGANTGVILEIRRERTVELVMEGFHLWDMFRWKEGVQFTKQFYGPYFEGVGEYDLDNDGTSDFLIYTNSKGDFKGTAMKLNKDIYLSDGDSGNMVALRNIKVEWNEERDYLWPIPASERVLTGGVLTQNPGWTDTTNF
jgi:hypothetical protein